MKVVKRPLVLLLSVLAVIGMISFITLSSNTSLGSASPISLHKDSESPGAGSGAPGAGARAHPANKQASLDESQQIVIQKEETTEPEKQDKALVKRPKPANKETEQPGINDIPSAGEYTETPFMPKMANETLKKQLGNASWRLFHTILARYPDTPTKQEEHTLQQYIKLFAQVYPCGDCARHFQKLLQKYPPQTKSRKNAALWGCDIHNKVNIRLEKTEYDCTTILEDYDCGCGTDEKEADATLGSETQEHLRNVQVSNEERQRG